MMYVLAQESINLDAILLVFVNGIKMKNIVHAHPFYKDLNFVQIMIIKHAKYNHNNVYGMKLLKIVGLDFVLIYQYRIV